MPARRLPAASTNEVVRARVPFTFDGRGYEGVWGEPVAVSLLAAGRRTLSRSFRFHRPRGLMCSTGQCGWCECEVDGRPSVRTCRVPLREGMVVRGEHAWPSVERDLLALLDLGSRFVPPTFYHHRFLRPRRLRKTYLDVIRWFGGRGRLGSGPAESRARVVRADAPDVLIVGGGRGGLLVAIGAAEDGARVVVLEAETARGVGSADTAALVADARAAGVDVRLVRGDGHGGRRGDDLGDPAARGRRRDRQLRTGPVGARLGPTGRHGRPHGGPTRDGARRRAGRAGAPGRHRRRAGSGGRRPPGGRHHGRRPRADRIAPRDRRARLGGGCRRC